MDKALLLTRLRRLDGWLVAAALALMVLGVLFIYSATYRGEGVATAGFHRRQILWCLVGLGCFLALTLTDYHRLGEAAWPLYAAALALLVLVLILGVSVSGSRRWLGFLGLRVQPSELAKVATIIALARFLSRPARDPARASTLVGAALFVAPPFALIFVEPDLGTAAVLLPVAFAMLFVAGVPLRTLAALAAAALLLLPAGWFVLDDYQRERILVFFDASRDPLGAGWNKMQSAIAVGSGGLTGKGYLAGTQNVLGYLPSKVAPTDFIYSVVAEEMGFTGSALVLSLYAAILVGAARAALLANDKLGRLLAAGVAGLLFSHVFVNIAMTIGLMPITGLPLPLMSYGGSFMVSTMAALGIVQSVYVRRSRR